MEYCKKVFRKIKRIKNKILRNLSGFINGSKIRKSGIYQKKGKDRIMAHNSPAPYAAILKKSLNITPMTEEEKKEQCVPETSTAYPDPLEYRFTFVGQPRKVDRFLEILNVGCVKHDRVWAWVITTPPCLVQFREVSQQYRNTSTYVVLAPDYGNYFNGFDNFGIFMNHLREVSQFLKGKCAEVGRDVSKWDDPEMKDGDMILGLRARIKLPNVLECLRNTQTSVRCVLRLSCVYFNRDKSSMSLEVIEATTSP